MKKKFMKSTSFITTLLYTVSVIIAICVPLTLYNSYAYISSLVAANRLVISQDLVSVISYYVNASVPYVFYAITTFAIGFIINKLNFLNVERDYEESELQYNQIIKKDEEELERFIDEIS